MKKILFMALFGMIAVLAFANTQVPSKDISVNATGYHGILATTDTDVQKVADKVNSISSVPGNAATATALATTPTECNQGNFPRGIDSSGNAKDCTALQNAITTGTTAQYFRGDLSLATFPTNLSSFTNGPGYITSDPTWDGGNVGINTTTAYATLNLGTASHSATTDFLASGGTAVNSSQLEGHAASYFQTAGVYMPVAGGNFTGNIGVGSSIPTQKIDVSGTVKATAFQGNGSLITNVNASALNAHADTYFQQALVSGTNIKTINTSSILGSGDLTVNSSQWGTLGNNIYFNTGNVGIGSSVPQSKLDVQGTVTAQGFSLGAGNVGIGTTATGNNALTVYGGNVGIGSTAAGKALDVVGTVRATAFLGDGSGLSGVSGLPTNMAPNYVQKAATASTLGSSLIYDNGTNVGIGSTVPQTKLDVNGAVNASGAISSTLAGDSYIGGNLGIGSSAPSKALDVIGSVKAVQFFGDGSQLSGVSAGLSGMAPGYAQKAATSTTLGSSLLYDNGTNAGIGSTAPQSKLDVAGTVTALAINTTAIKSPGNGNVGIGSTNPTNKLDVAGSVYVNGNIGIGSTNPANALDVNGAISSTATGNSYIGGNLGVGSIAPAQKLDVQGSAYFNGNVGIGSSVPQQKLDVIGTVKATAFVGDGSGLTGLSAGTNYWSLGGSVGINTTNNVGIGSSQPSQKLDVIGTTKSTAFIGDGSGLTNLGVVAGFGYYLSRYPPTQDTNYVKATSNLATYNPWNATDPSISLVGSGAGLYWISNSATTNQRFHIDVGNALVITKVYYENGHASGANTTRGVQHFTLWGSNNAAAFAELTYATDTNWTQLTTDVSVMVQHVAADVTDPHYVVVNNSTAYRYYAFKFADNWGDVTYMDIRRLVLMTAQSTTYGSVGVGTSSPTGTLEIMGIGTTSATSSLIIRNSAGAEKVQIKDDGSVLTGGNVGISTSGPTACVCKNFKNGWCIDASCT